MIEKQQFNHKVIVYFSFAVIVSFYVLNTLPQVRECSVRKCNIKSCMKVQIYQLLNVHITKDKIGFKLGQVKLKSLQNLVKAHLMLQYQIFQK